MRRFFLLICALPLLFSCTHIRLSDIDAAKASLKVVYDWVDAPDANPKGMSIFFYPENGGHYYRYELSAKGGEIYLPVGRYRIITYNNDSHSTMQGDFDNYNSHVIFNYDCDILRPLELTASQELIEALNLSELVMLPPDMMWGCNADVVEVFEKEGQQVITLKPHELMAHYSVEIRNVKNLKSVTRMCMSLSGLADALYIGDESLTEYSAIFPFECKVEGESTIMGEFLTFGNNVNTLKEHRVRLIAWCLTEVVDDNGEPVKNEKGHKQYANKPYIFYKNDIMNVTEQVDKALNQKRVHVIIDGSNVIEFPDEPKPDVEGGLSPDISDWVSEDWIITL